jgi:flagellar hook-basal body complex protein FliE
MAIDKMNPAAAADIYKSSMNQSQKPGVSGGDGTSFGSMVKKAGLESLEALREGEKVSAQAVMGTAELTDVVQAVTEAEVTLQTIVAMRDRMMSAYQEIMRMPV